MKVSVRVETRIYPTEDENIVIHAIKQLFPESTIKIERDVVTGEVHDLKHFKELLNKQKILDAARSELLKGVKNGHTVIYLNKQTAVIGKVNFTDENALLSPIRLELKSDELRTVIDFLAPPTKNGKPFVEVDK